MDDHRYMCEALSLAEKGRGFVSPNPMVGCVIIKDAHIVGRGYHRRCGACHAEVAALTEAGEAARGATMYVTLQPCNHYGKTPPCTSAVIESGVRRLVIAAKDPNPKTKCRDGLARLRSAKIEVQFGVCAQEAERQNEVYFHNLKYERPFVALKLATTLDGRIADLHYRSKWISGPEAREFAHHLRAEYDAILVGSNTIDYDDPRLTCRLEGRRNPVRVVLASTMKLGTRSAVFNQPGRTIVLCAPGPSEKHQARYRAKGIEFHEVSSRGRILDWPSVLEFLWNQGITSVLIEGGGLVATTALLAEVVNKLYFFVAPKILGQGRSYFEPPEMRALGQALELREWRPVPVGRDILIEAYL
jgi:diaminohydroxyphosphoribosylaminopyrimidine deaminase/5-amino-6-(5-phosphoribosylamino)uracil reductase